jgi:hypothetical protein
MSASDDALLNHLRADIELKAEVIKALRGERERDVEAAAEQAALLAAVSAELVTLASNVGLLLAESGSGAVQRATEKFKSACADLADFTAAKTGQLALSHRPVNVLQLLSRIASRYAVELKIAVEVPERIVTDEMQLARLLAYFVGEGVESGARMLEVSAAAGPDSAPRLVFGLHPSSRGGEASAERTHEMSSIGRLRLALVGALCELMGATRAPARLTLPLQSAKDQAETGMFRLALSDHEVGPAATKSATAMAARTAVAAAAPDEPLNEDESIDLMYLDRQLGSLAQVILTRTAPAFIADAPRRMTNLHVAHESEDIKRLHGIVQAWKGSALSVGARKLAALFDAIERHTGAGRLPTPAAIWQVRSALGRVVQTLEAQARAPGRP